MFNIRFIRIFLIVVSCIGLMLSGNYMSNNTFWGNWPLVLFASAWILFLCIEKIWKWNDPIAQSYLLLSSASGILLGIGFAPVPVTPLLFIAWIPFFIFEQTLQSSDHNKKGRIFWKYTYNMLIVWNIISTYWVSNASLIPGISAMLINALFMSVTLLGFYMVSKHFPRYKYLAWICFWMSFEYLHWNWEISWPWLSLGNAWAMMPYIVQWYEYTGLFGGGLWIMVLNILIFKFLNKPQKQLKDALVPGAVLLLPIINSLFIYYTYKEQGTAVSVAIVQPNYEPHYEKFDIPEEYQMTKFLDLTKQVVDSNTQYLVFPETSFNNIRTDNMHNDSRIVQLQSFANTYPNLCVVTGLSTTKVYADNEPLGPAARKSRRSSTPIYFEIQNSAVQLCGDDENIPLYIKSKLVPGAEIFPYRHLLPFLKPIIDQLGGTLEGHATQEERAAFDNGNYKIAPVICYETIYGEYTAGYVEKGAQAMFVMTNDGWWDDTWGHKQLLKYGVLRCIEYRKSVARSANTGISCFINQRGDILQATDYEVDAAIKGEIYFNDIKTVYYYIGDIIAKIAILGMLIFVSILLFARKKV